MGMISGGGNPTSPYFDYSLAETQSALEPKLGTDQTARNDYLASANKELDRIQTALAANPNDPAAAQDLNDLRVQMDQIRQDLDDELATADPNFIQNLDNLRTRAHGMDSTPQDLPALLPEPSSEGSSPLSPTGT